MSNNWGGNNNNFNNNNRRWNNNNNNSNNNYNNNNNNATQRWGAIRNEVHNNNNMNQGWGNKNNNNNNFNNNSGGNNMHGKRWRENEHGSNNNNFHNNNNNKRRRFNNSYNNNNNNNFMNNRGGRGGGRGGRGGGRGGRGGFGGQRNNMNNNKPPIANPAGPNKLSFKDFLATQPDNIDPKESQKRYRQYEKDWYKIRNEVDMKQWLSSRANDDLMREYYLPHIKEKHEATKSEKSGKMSQLIERCVGTKKLDVISMCKDTSNDNLESIENRQKFVNNKTILFIPTIPVFITREELNRCIVRVEKEVLEVDFKNEEESKRTLYERIIKSRKVFVSDPRRNPARRFERSANIWYHSIFIEGATKEEEDDITLEDITKVTEAIFSKLKDRKIVDDHDFKLFLKYGRDMAPVPMPLGTLNTKMLEKSIESIVGLSNALALRKGLVVVNEDGGETIAMESYVPLQKIIDNIKEEEKEEETEATEASGEKVLVTREKRTMLINQFEVCLTYLFLVHHIDYFDFNVEYIDGGDRFFCIGKRCYQINKTLAYGARNREEDLELKPIQEEFLNAVQTKTDEIKDPKALEKAKLQLEQDKNEYKAFVEDRLPRLQEKFINDNTKQEGPNRYRCPLSNKLFKGPEFVRKHILLKFEDKIKEYQQQQGGVDVEWILQKHSTDPNRGDFIESKLAPRIGLRSRYVKKKDKGRMQMEGQTEVPPLLLPSSGEGSKFRQYNSSGSPTNKKYNNDNQQGRLDPRARRLQSYGDVDEFAEDDLVYTR